MPFSSISSARLALAAVSFVFWPPVHAWVQVTTSFSTPFRESALYSSVTNSNNNNIKQEEIAKCLTESVERMNQVMTTEFFESSPVLSVLRSQCIKRVAIKESTIPGAGRGLFAINNIQSGTIISFYPVHALGIDDVQSLPQFYSLPQDEDYFQSHPCSESSYLHCTDQPLFQRASILHPVLPNGVPLYLDVNPNREMVGAWVSHMINDGAVVQSNSVRGVLDYYQESGNKKNCIHIPWGPSPVMATVTTKKVKKGEELFTSYGGTYWLGVLLNVRGEEGIGITDEIQQKITESATDLVKSMKTVSQLYATQATAMQVEFEKRVTTKK